LLVSQVVPKGVVAFDLIDGVWIAEYRCAIPVGIALRQSLIELSAVRQAGEGQQTKMAMVYQYLTGPRFRHRIEAIVEKFSDMQQDLDKERKTMTRLWAKPEPVVPDCPAELGPVARREWDRLASELGKLKLLTSLDRAALGAYCGAYALWAEATEAIQKFGTMVKSPSGFPIQSPYVSIANRQAEIMMRIASEFGFTPASRSRISTPTEAEPTLFDIPDERSGKAIGK
jgi:P27 family predicted phage terminase small subunit